jgi:hypothetical protein
MRPGDRDATKLQALAELELQNGWSRRHFAVFGRRRRDQTSMGECLTGYTKAAAKRGRC